MTEQDLWGSLSWAESEDREARKLLLEPEPPPPPPQKTLLALTDPEDLEPLTPEEAEPLIARGLEAAKGHELVVPAMEQEKLKSFVREYVAGLIYTDRDLRKQDVHMVFPLLLMGALQPQADAEKALAALLIDTGEEPKVTDPPAAPKPLEAPAPPPEPIRPRLRQISPNPTQVEAMTSAIEWNRLRHEDLDVYLAQVEALAERCRARHPERVALWERKHAEWETRCQQLTKEHQQNLLDQAKEYAEALGAHTVANACVLERHAAWKRQQAENAALARGFYSQYLTDLGCVWEHYSKAAPRSVNGKPMFFSLRVMNKGDFARASKAISRELARGQDLEV